MYAVYSLAHREASIVASGPAVRLNGFLGLDDAMERAFGSDTETRVWQCTSGPKVAEQNIEVHWRPITRNSCHKTLNDEYESTWRRFEDWKTWRESVSREVLDAARDRRMRDVLPIRATKLLADYDATVAASAAMVSQSVQKLVPKLTRDDEIRGQTWAIIAICGDALYERQRQEILEALGRQYISELRLRTKLETEDLDELEAALSNSDALDLAFVKNFKDDLDALSPEPLVAFFEASDDPEALTKRADLYATSHELKHADVAVVRLYEWIRLDRRPNRATHSNRDPKAHEFFQTLRTAEA